MARCFDLGCSIKIRMCRPAQLTYQKKVKKWDNFSNFWPIVLKIGKQVNLTKPLATVTFFNYPNFFYQAARPTKTSAYREILQLPKLQYLSWKLDET